MQSARCALWDFESKSAVRAEGPFVQIARCALWDSGRKSAARAEISSVCFERERLLINYRLPQGAILLEGQMYIIFT